MTKQIIQEKIEECIKKLREENKKDIINDSETVPYILAFHLCGNCNELLVGVAPLDIPMDLLRGIFPSVLRSFVEVGKYRPCAKCKSKDHALIGYSFTTEAWGVEAEFKESNITPCEDPRRIEMLFSILKTKELAKKYQAEIIRYETKIEVRPDAIEVLKGLEGIFVVDLF